MGGLENLVDGSAMVYYVHGVGYGEQVTFRCSGHGAEYAYSLAKFLCGPSICEKLEAEKVAERIAYVISWVSEDVDSTVGGLPTVAMMRDGESRVIYLPEERLRKIEDQVKQHKFSLPKILGFCDE